MSRITRIPLLTSLLLLSASLTWAGQPDTRPNAAQADLAESFVCPPPNGWRPVPVDIALTTTGGPVLLSAAVQAFWFDTRLPISLGVMFTVDGQPVERSRLDSTGLAVALTPPRLLDVPAGPHTFGLSVLCLTSTVHLQTYEAWLLAYELPSLPPGLQR